jgi:hypothetical protein
MQQVNPLNLNKDKEWPQKDLLRNRYLLKCLPGRNSYFWNTSRLNTRVRLKTP